MELIVPPFLKPGDTIGIVAPARKVSEDEIAPAIQIVKGWGLNVVLGKNLFGNFNQFSGTDFERAADLQEMFENPDIKAILCARGGYGSVRLLDKINLRELQRNPKWLVGYSDITVLHGILNNWYLVETLHATMPINFPKDGKDDRSTTLLKQTLFGKSPFYNIEPNKYSRTGSGEGFITGGNLSILYSLSGTDADIAADEKILFIEDLDEYLYHIDRMIMNLKHSGKLKNLAGLVVGSMSDMHDNAVPFGKTAYEIIREAVDEYDYPVCFGFPAGHSGENVPLILGRKAKLEITEMGATLQFSAPNCNL